MMKSVEIAYTGTPPLQIRTRYDGRNGTLSIDRKKVDPLSITKGEKASFSHFMIDLKGRDIRHSIPTACLHAVDPHFRVPCLLE
jgi:hypothetical protein